MKIPATLAEQRALHAKFTDIASNAIGWANGAQKTRGYIGAGWRVRAVGDEATSLFNHLISHGPEEIFADTLEGEKSRTLISSHLRSITSLREAR